jgi:hypothetical protein
MALAKISLEIEVEDTFQNGTKLNMEEIYNLLFTTASEEYDRQFQENRLVHRFQMSMRADGESAVEITKSVDLEDDTLELTESAPEGYRFPRKRRHSHGMAGMSHESTALMLPK